MSLNQPVDPFLALLAREIHSIDTRLSAGTGVVHQSTQDIGEIMGPRTNPAAAPQRPVTAAAQPQRAVTPTRQAAPVAAPAAARPAQPAARPVAAAAPARAVAAPVTARPAQPAGRAVAAPVAAARPAQPAARPAQAVAAPTRRPAPQPAAPVDEGFGESFDATDDQGFGANANFDAPADPGFDAEFGGAVEGGFEDPAFDGVGDETVDPDGGEFGGGEFGDEFGGDEYTADPAAVPEDLDAEPAVEDIVDSVTPRLRPGTYFLGPKVSLHSLVVFTDGNLYADGDAKTTGASKIIKVTHSPDLAMPIANMENSEGTTWVAVQDSKKTGYVVRAEDLLNEDKSAVTLEVPKPVKAARVGRAAVTQVEADFDTEEQPVAEAVDEVSGEVSWVDLLDQVQTEIDNDRAAVDARQATLDALRTALGA